MIVLKLPPEEERMLSVSVELVVGSSDVGVVLQWHGSIETIPRGIHAVPDGVVVRHRVRLKELEHGLALANVLRIDLLNLRRREFRRTAARVLVGENALTEQHVRHDADSAALAGIPAAFVVQEVEQPVLLDGTADATRQKHCE